MLQHEHEDCQKIAAYSKSEKNEYNGTIYQLLENTFALMKWSER